MYVDSDIQEIWSHEFSSDAPIYSAKAEAGIFFIYDENGNVLSTLDGKGNKIGG